MKKFKNKKYDTSKACEPAVDFVATNKANVWDDDDEPDIMVYTAKAGAMIRQLKNGNPLQAPRTREEANKRIESAEQDFLSGKGHPIEELFQELESEFPWLYK